MNREGKNRKWLPPMVAGLTVAVTLVIGLIYFNFMTQRIDSDSASHLKEIYGQVSSAFGAFVDTRWSLLGGWGDALASRAQGAADGATMEAAAFADFVRRQRDDWGFSEFYFLSRQRTGRTLDGDIQALTLDEDAWTRLLDGREPILSGETLADRRGITVFAVPVQPGVIDGFAFEAIAVGYANEGLSASLKVDAFSGKARCFVVHDDGRVLLSTQSGGNVFQNYLLYLRAASDLSEAALSRMQADWQRGQDGVVQCEIGDVDHFVLYQPVGYLNFVLLSVVPRGVVSAGFVSVQKTTRNAMFAIFLLLGAALLGLFLYSSRLQRRKSRTELQYRERMFDVLSNSVDDIFLMMDCAAHSVDYVSPNVERLLGIPADEVRADVRAMRKCVVSEEALFSGADLSAIPLGGSAHQECEYVHQRTGERRWYRMTLYHMSIQEMRKYIVVLSDRTQEQQMKQKLQEALSAAQSANEAKSNFLSNMSHDIRTPMNAIVGFSVLLEKEADHPEKVREYIRKIRASSQHLLGLINDVLDMSKIESGKTSLNVGVFSLPALLEGLSIILNAQVRAKHQTFEIHVQGAPPEQLIGDKLRLNQILLNLLSNAVKYTQEGGRIEFIVSVIPQSAPQYVALRFIVRDNGIGMSEAFQREIFMPFSREINAATSEIQGTGLGMAITKSLVDLMGGVITLSSAPGQGSTFTVELSFARADEETTSQPWPKEMALEGLRMLVADDEEEICLDIVTLLRDTGIQIDYVTDGLAAVERAAQAHARGEGFHLILLDWKMPGLDGVETAKRIRERVGTDVPILVLTSYDWADIEAQARAAGIDAFMEKPFFVSTFVRTVKPLLANLPALAGGAAETAAETDEKTAEEAMKGRLFLVAEDNELNAEILTEMLSMEGARCELAENGQEAVSMFEASAPGHYDMILMDVQMPVMNGYDATRAIRASAHPDAKRIPIVAMTANTFAEDVKKALDAGMNGHLGKPIDMDAVRKTVAGLLGWKDDA